jgi:hypothetical protein
MKSANFLYTFLNTGVQILNYFCQSGSGRFISQRIMQIYLFLAVSVFQSLKMLARFEV